jgi:hypothetical protein
MASSTKKQTMHLLLGVLLAPALFVGAGCGDSATSRDVSQAEIKQGQDNRIKEIENNPNLTAEQKAAMIETVKGNIPGRDDANRK